MNFFYKLFNGLHVFVYRLTGGKLGGIMMGFKVLIINTVGRKSGKIHANPLGFFERDGGYLIVASNGGLNSHPAWYYNLKAVPVTTVQIMGRQLPVRAEIITGEKRADLWDWMVNQAPAYGKYKKMTTREIPLVWLSPSK